MLFSTPELPAANSFFWIDRSGNSCASGTHQCLVVFQDTRQDLKIQFRGQDQCGPCGVVCDSFPDKDWEECIESYRNKKPGFVDLWNKCKDVAEKGASAFLPKAVRSAVNIGVQFCQVFLFLPVILFNVYFPDIVLSEVKKLKKVILLDFQNEKQDGLLLKPTEKGRALNLPEVRLFRDSTLYIEEDLCPAMQIREKQSSEVFSFQSKKRVKGRNQVLKDLGCQKALSIESVARECKRWRKLQKAKPKDGEPIELDSEDGKAENRTLVDADVEGEAPAPKKKSRGIKRKHAKAKEAIAKFRESLVQSGSGTKEKTARTKLERKGDPRDAEIISSIGDGDDFGTDREGDDADDDALSGSEGEVQKNSKLDHEAILRGTAPMGNKEQGV